MKRALAASILFLVTCIWTMDARAIKLPSLVEYTSHGHPIVIDPLMVLSVMSVPAMARPIPNPNISESLREAGPEKRTHVIGPQGGSTLIDNINPEQFLTENQLQSQFIALHHGDNAIFIKATSITSIAPYFAQGRSVDVCHSKTEGAVCSFENDLPDNTNLEGGGRPGTVMQGTCHAPRGAWLSCMNPILNSTVVGGGLINGWTVSEDIETVKKLVNEVRAQLDTR